MVQSTQRSEMPPTFSTSDPAFTRSIKAQAKFKERSHNTHSTIHIPSLCSYAPGSTLDAVFIGHSMLERFKTTGVSTRIAKLPRHFNAGVGGDKIASVLYRVDLGLLRELEKFEPKIWIVCVGTNDLRPNRTLGDKELEAYKVLLQACLRTSVGSRILATAVTYRKDIPDAIVDASNERLKRVGEKLNEEVGCEVVRWLDKPEGLDKERHLVDHVHFNEEGYWVWDEVLFPVVEETIELPMIEFTWEKKGVGEAE
jgi:lysophospholipase L1-like esterase